MNIKHIVLSGGGPIVYVQYGVIKQLIKNKIILVDNIESIYSVSAGCISALLTVLNFNTNITDKYLIERPWDKIFNEISNYEYINLFYNKGIYDINIIKKVIDPLLIAKNFSPDITLKQFYNATNIELHMFATNITTASKVDLNYMDYPDYKLVDCIYMSCCAPILLKPYFINDNCFIDGCMLTTVPYYNCLNDKKCKYNEIIILSCYPNDDTNYIKNMKYFIDNNIKKNPEEDIIEYINETYINLKYNDISKNNLNNLNNLNNDISENNVNNNITQNTNIIMFFLYMLKNLVNKILSLDNIIENRLYNLDPLIDKQFINCAYVSSANINVFDWVKTISNKIERKSLIIYGEIICEQYLNKYNINNDTSDNTIDISNNIVT